MNPYLTEEERKMLAAAKVGIAGAGGLGSNAAMHLVRAGVKRLAIADFDIVSESNLNRQFFFRDQLGMKKTEALAANLLRIEPELELELHDARLDAGNVKAVFAGCTHIVEALDSAEGKALVYASFPSLPVAGASGIAGWGRTREITLKRIGRNLLLAGDFESDVSDSPPQAPRVAIAAAIEANAILSVILGKEI